MGHQELIKGLSDKLGVDVISGKGGFWAKGKGFYTIAQARKLTGIKATPRNYKPIVSAWGDYATIAQINRVRF